MTRYETISRLVRLPLAMVAAILTLAIMARATQTITTPNAVVIGYNLAAGANSASVTPVSNQSVLVMGVCTTPSVRGTGHVTLLHVSGAFLEWVGLESPTPAAITSGFSGALGTHIVFLDFDHLVDIEVNSADTFRIHNGSVAGRAGNVTMIW